ncbi:MAG: hypothetical protein WBL80_07915 [Erysipelotrichaceae bacterium]
MILMEDGHSVLISKSHFEDMCDKEKKKHESDAKHVIFALEKDGRAEMVLLIFANKSALDRMVESYIHKGIRPYYTISD